METNRVLEVQPGEKTDDGDQIAECELFGG